MSSSITEVVERRQEIAAKNAHAAAVRLRDGDSDDLHAQLEVEDRLDELHRYTRMSEDLREIATDLGPYGRRSKHDLRRSMP